jgi:hypothetical protein
MYLCASCASPAVFDIPVEPWSPGSPATILIMGATSRKVIHAARLIRAALERVSPG